MPFPLAHPAAVLPLRRLCPRWLNFPALVAGSIVPDLSYLLSQWQVDELAHRGLEGFLFSIPAGLLVLAGLSLGLRVARLAAPRWLGPGAMDFRPAVVPGRGRFRSILVVVLSLAVGSATHVMWDSFTHKTGWLASHAPLLTHPLLLLFGRALRPYHVLWYLSSVGGAAIIAYGWLRWREGLRGLPRASAAARVIISLLLATLVVPMAAAHHLMPQPMGNLLAATLLLLVMLGLLALSRPSVTFLTPLYIRALGPELGPDKTKHFRKDKSVPPR